MIQLTKKQTAAVPAILTTKGKIAADALAARFSNGETEFTNEDFDSKIYGHAAVKAALIEIQDYKCCFCESKIGHISYGDVEHFRPKAGWVQDTEKLNKPGYYWLAYSWDNLLLSCQLCNQRHKKNFFPLIGNGVERKLSHTYDIAAEQPVFIHPAIDNPEAFITFKEEIPVAVGGNERGAKTIEILGLDRELLNEQRRKIFSMLKSIYDLAKGYPDTPTKGKARAEVEKYQEQSVLNTTEFASMFRAFFRDNPIDF